MMQLYHVTKEHWKSMIFLNFTNLEKSCVNQTCVVINELEKKHLHCVTSFILHLSSWGFQICTFSSNHLKYESTDLNAMIMRLDVINIRYCL